MNERITVNPKVLGGTPCIRGMRIPVHVVVEMVAAGMSTEAILRNYPELQAEDVQAALEYTAPAASEHAG